jgi:hypothetical protein
MGVANKNLRNRATPCFFHHFDPTLGVQVNTHFFDLGHTSRPQQLFGTNAVGTNGR